MEHELKIWFSNFEAIIQGIKRHEVRTYDRNFQEGDTVWLREWDPLLKKYSGREKKVVITDLTHPGTFGLPDDLCAFTFRLKRGR